MGRSCWYYKAHPKDRQTNHQKNSRSRFSVYLRTLEDTSHSILGAQIYFSSLHPHFWLIKIILAGEIICSWWNQLKSLRIHTCGFPKIGVPPKSSFFFGSSIINHSFLGTPHGHPHFCRWTLPTWLGVPSPPGARFGVHTGAPSLWTLCVSLLAWLESSYICEISHDTHV